MDSFKVRLSLECGRKGLGLCKPFRAVTLTAQFTQFKHTGHHFQYCGIELCCSEPICSNYYLFCNAFYMFMFIFDMYASGAGPAHLSR